MNVTINSNSVRGRREAALQQANIGSGFYNLVNGQHLTVAQTLDVIDPVTGKALAKVPDVDQSDLDSAVEAAATAFRSWRRTPWDVRKAVVGRVVEALGEHMDELTTLLAAEGGHSIGMTEWEIKWITDLYGPSLLATELTEESWVEERVGQVVKRYVPLGVVCAISPWNLPFLLVRNTSFDSLAMQCANPHASLPSTRYSAGEECPLDIKDGCMLDWKTPTDIVPQALSSFYFLP